MNEKLLTLIVPTYNMEIYLRRCLDSVTREDVSDSIEVIVVNDGSKDSSLDIAREYEKKRPDVVVVVDKPNGNYGSCVNAALPLVRGKYVKMLDADDWYDTDGLISLLSCLKDLECDMFITHYKWVFSDGDEVIINYSSKWEESKIYNVDEVFGTDDFYRLQMHQIAFRTTLLRGMKYVQTEGISYTDAEWTYKPLFHVNDVAFVDSLVYCYYIGRAGQTMDSSVLVKSLSHEAKSLMSMIEYRRTQPEVKKPNLANYLRFRSENRCFNFYFNALVYMSDDDFAKLDLASIDNRIKELGEQEYFKVAHYDFRSWIVRYWRNKNKRPNHIVRFGIGQLFTFYSNIKKKWNPHR